MVECPNFKKLSMDSYKKAIEYKNEGNIDDAIFYLEKSLEFDEDFEEAKIELDKCYDNKGNEFAKNKDYEKAIEFYDKSLELSPTSFITLYNKAKALYFNDDQNESLNYFKKILELYPDKREISKHIKKINDERKSELISIVENSNLSNELKTHLTFKISYEIIIFRNFYNK